MACLIHVLHTDHGHPLLDAPRYESEEARKALVQELHLLKTQLFMDTIEAGKVPLRPGVLRVVDAAIQAGVPLVRACLPSLLTA